MQYVTPLLPAYPELFLLVMVCVILVTDLFVSDDSRIVTYVLTQATLLGCFLLTYLTAAVAPVPTFSDMFVDDLMADVLKLLVYLGVMVMLVYSRPYIAARGMFRGEFFVLVLFATLEPCEVAQISLAAYPKLSAWRQELKQQPFYTKCYKEYGEMLKK